MLRFVKNRQHTAAKIVQQIGLLLLQTRERLALTQAELAELSGVSARSIRELENGRGNIGIRPLQQLLRVLGLTLEIKQNA